MRHHRVTDNHSHKHMDSHRHMDSQLQHTVSLSNLMDKLLLTVTVTVSQHQRTVNLRPMDSHRPMDSPRHNHSAILLRDRNTTITTTMRAPL